MNKRILEVIHPSCPFYDSHDNSSSLTSECLFGEYIEVLEVFDNWIYGKLLYDGYKGWTESKYLGESRKKNYKVVSTRTTLHIVPNLKTKVFFFLPLGSLLNVIKFNEEWAQISYNMEDKICLGYVPSKHIMHINKYDLDWVSIAEKLVGTPYRWGGRNTIGIDCSALVQLCLQAIGKKIPRDTDMQKKIKYPIIKDVNLLKRGMLIFWDGHVAISIDNRRIIHANAYHMETIIEPLNTAIRRLVNETGNIQKILNLN